MQQRQKILRILYVKAARDPLQMLNKEDLLEQMAMTWDDLRLEMMYLEEKGYISVKRRNIGTRVFEAFYITVEGVNWVEGRAIESHSAPSLLLESIPLRPIESFERTEQTLSIFFSYAREDEVLRKELEKHLGVLQRQGLIDIWYDREISAGTEWKLQIDMHLDSAQIILLLVSPDFVNSDYCYGKEMKRAIERHKGRKAWVIPILLRPVFYKGAPFEKLWMLSNNGMPITSWSHQDEAFQDVAKGISEVVKELTSAPAQFPLVEKRSDL